MGPPAPGQPVSGQAVRFRVTIDGAAPGADHGADTDAEGWGSLQDTRLYQLVRQSGDIADRTFQIEFEGAGDRKSPRLNSSHQSASRLSSSASKKPTHCTTNSTAATTDH